MEKQKHLELPKIKLSVALATFNEGLSIKECLESIKNLAQEIVVVDGSSTDNTVEIARSFGAKAIITTNKPIFHINKQQAIDECQGDWVLLLDADEVVPSDLAEEIKTVIQDGVSGTVAYWLKRRKMFLGKWMKKGGQYPDPVVRLFKKGRAFLPCQSVHEQMKVDGEIGWLKNDLIHLPTCSFTSYLTKDNRYSTLTALEMKNEKLKINFFSFCKYFFWEPNKIFFSIYLRHKGFLDGFPGFIFALYSGLHITNAYIKYWEMEKTLSEHIEEDWV
ncbi:hypothetical protein COS54_03385 [Candidatus Shapirobacteria bacterium CG03_land_8_20_14_0_80_39_12]|uniref:Glycosyltransferase 2-like domain-containing protein n=1 Tax=Candidatus Shapirobacteria bacterium CG03_land_8_20_14_0_80_39_12 TaxID=1974879 RepID=A0A2M7BB21_9BACT|nr:MAG: hypothetical protein COS54_03385 [Candidatus Shapirobacteria bacterium CG03_land_8_20_14_0_80_39_12]